MDDSERATQVGEPMSKCKQWLERLRRVVQQAEQQTPEGTKRYYVEAFGICSVDPSTKQGAQLALCETAIDVFSSGEFEPLSPLWTVDRQGNVYYLRRGQESGTTEIWMVPVSGK